MLATGAVTMWPPSDHVIDHAMTNNAPKSPISRDAAIKWGLIGLFVLEGLCAIMSYTPGMSRTFYDSVIVLSVVAILCTVLYWYLIVPPIKDDGDDDETQ
jgi:hypothetical protein